GVCEYRPLQRDLAEALLRRIDASAASPTYADQYRLAGEQIFTKLQRHVAPLQNVLRKLRIGLIRTNKTRCAARIRASCAAITDTDADRRQRFGEEICRYGIAVWNWEAGIHYTDPGCE